MKRSIVSGLVVLSLISFSSCVKKTDCGATVICTDQNGSPVANAKVKLFATVKPSPSTTVIADVKADGVTDADGKVKFVFKLPAIFDINATYAVNGSTLSSTGIIKLEEGKRTEKTLTLK